MFDPRPGQNEVVNYQSGKMGIAAVPGSGKTHTLSYLAARLVAGEDLAEDQEVLIVTLVNSAVDNFSSRVAGFLRERDLLPGIGYRVRTLHGLAYDIIREQPGLAGLDTHFSIIDERASIETLNYIVHSWKLAHPDFIANYTHPDQNPEKIGQKWNELLSSLAGNFIKQAKDYELTPESLKLLLDKEKGEFPLLEMGYSFYSAYQQSLKMRGAVDFEDLIRLAYKVLSNHKDYLDRLRHRWPVILEDEAQDSSLIQEKLLGLLCGTSGNWVRVGDPNQAIFETFTTAEPRLLREFLQRDDVAPVDLMYSGRSAPAIISLANYLNDWTREMHPVLELRDTLSKPHIHPTPPGDPQPNPADSPNNIVLHMQELQPADELKLVANSARKWLADNPQGTLAILTPRNARGAEVVEYLEKMKVPVFELLRSSKSTRDIARILGVILNFFSHPTSLKYLQDAVLSILEAKYEKTAVKDISKDIKDLVKDNKFTEILFEGNNSSKGGEINPSDVQNPEALFQQAIQYLNLWQHTVLLPIDQMVMTMSAYLFKQPAELALAHKLAVLLKNGAKQNPTWHLPEFYEELNNIAKNRFRLYGFASDDTGFDPDDHKGEVVVATMHKAKGLEWDRVYLLSVNNYDFPSAQPDDYYISEKWFVRDNLNLEAELIAQLKSLVNGDGIGLRQSEGQATLDARLEYSSERLRLLYVGITRARRELIITYNNGRRGNCHKAIPLEALSRFQEQHDGN